MNDSVERARALFTEALSLLGQGRFGDAEQRLEASLQHVPGRASTLLNLGVTRLRLARPQAALQALDAALAAEPDAADAWGHGGAALAGLGRFDEALASFDEALARAPGDQAASYHRAMTLNALRRDSEALAAFDALTRSHPDKGLFRLQQARTLQCLGRHDEALPAYRRALALDPTLGEGWSLLGQLLKDRGQAEEAASCFEQALAHGAPADLNRWFLAAVRGGSAPAHAPPAYVRVLFDGYAAEFDRHLRQGLHYRAPEELDRLLASTATPRSSAAIDLGCGTGLCAPMLLRHARQLDGVDLSAAMLERARARRHYRQLVQSELAAHLQSTSERYGLVVAADVFIYVGALDAVFAGVRRVLEPGGRFAFSVETADEAVPYELRPTLRYAHGVSYLRELALRQGLRWLAEHAAPLREDQGRPVPGRYLLLAAA